MFNIREKFKWTSRNILPKKFCQLLFNIPGEQPKEFSTEWLDANECSVEQPAVAPIPAPIPDPSD